MDYSLESRSPLKSYLLLVAACAAICLLAKVPFWTADHREPDEVVYWTLAQRLTWGQYDLGASEVLRGGYISPAIYDRPLFHHPPLYPALLNPFARMGWVHGAVLVSWLGHLLALAAVAWAGWELMRARGLSCRAPAVWLPLAGVALDPHLLFDARSLWMDPLLGGLVALSLVAIITRGECSTWRRWALAGALLGLAANTKVTALVALPVGALMILIRGAIQNHEKSQNPNSKFQIGNEEATEESETHAHGQPSSPECDGAPGEARASSMKAAVVAVGIYAGVALAMVVPWLTVFWAEYHTLTPTWIKGDTWTIERQPYVAWVMSRPWWEYCARLTWMTPVVWWALGVGAVLCLTKKFEIRNSNSETNRSKSEIKKSELEIQDSGNVVRLQFAQAAVWVVGLLAVMTVLGTRTTGFQMRYLSPMIPGMYVMLGAALAMLEGRDAKRNAAARWVAWIAVALVAYGALNMSTNYRFPEAPVLVSIFETGRLTR